ncbi:hypothetical protein Dda_3799 [Drechslerella dactyloides]|uniref:Uncharacterized protein n=1 Tax=Drechslerella dactyloides TaxID=74499 RepID=A0AAD6IYK8_DREDA|nr:hypothetical protein Dda_3799 [Drechslerella dactyloides]
MRRKNDTRGEVEDGAVISWKHQADQSALRESRPPSDGLDRARRQPAREATSASITQVRETWTSKPPGDHEFNCTSFSDAWTSEPTGQTEEMKGIRRRAAAATGEA